MISSINISFDRRYWKRVYKYTNKAMAAGINPVIKNYDTHKEIAHPVHLIYNISWLSVFIPIIPVDYKIMTIGISPIVYTPKGKKLKNVISEIYITKNILRGKQVYEVNHGTHE